MAPAALSDIAPGLLVAALAAIALVSPVFAGEGIAPLIALLLIGAGLLECWHGFRRSTPAGQRAAWIGGAITIAMGLLVQNAAALAAISEDFTQGVSGNDLAQWVVAMP
jgi:uncharacterized membrane protein HdeD (DUF308 family)